MEKLKRLVNETINSNKKTTGRICVRLLYYGLKSKYTKEQIVINVFTDLKNEGIGLNCRGFKISIFSIRSELYMFLRDIKNKRKGWWSDYNISIENNIVKIKENNIKA